MDGWIRAFSMLVSWQGKLSSQDSRKAHLTLTIWLCSDLSAAVHDVSAAVCLLRHLEKEEDQTLHKHCCPHCPTHEAESNTQKTAWSQAVPGMFSPHVAGTCSWTWELRHLWGPTLCTWVHSIPSTNTSLKNGKYLYAVRTFIFKSRLRDLLSWN